jgi:SAM-dependent methyltransferase
MMDAAEGARAFLISGQAYDNFMGRYSQPLARTFADAARVAAGSLALDVGCGPGALTAQLVDRLGPEAVFACDPSAPFVAECSARHPDVDVRLGRAEAIPFDDDRFDTVLSQLVLHFVSDPAAAVSEMRRVARAGATVAACVWDFAEGMQMLRLFWDAALAVDSSAPDEARVLQFGREGEIAELFGAHGLHDIAETTIAVEVGYADFTELWSGFLAGVGPAGTYCVSLPEDHRQRVHDELFERLGSPTGGFRLTAVARCATATEPAPAA